MQLRNLLLSGAIVLSLTQGQEAIAQKKATATKKLLDPANLDTSVKPGDNFFLYANGTWLKNNPIPADQTRWGSFSELQERNLNALHEILETTAKIKNAPKNSINQKVGDFYRTGMDTAAIEKAGITPLNGLFAEIDRIKDAATLQEIGAASSENPLLIKIDTNSGHGASNTKKNLESTADIYSFIWWNMGFVPKF